MKGVIRKEFDKNVKAFNETITKTGLKIYKALPKEGLKPGMIVKRLEELSEIELKIKNQGRYQGLVYSTEEELMQLNAEASNLFLFSDLSDPHLHTLSKQMENEIVKMVINLFNGGPECSGITTSGGSESVEMAILSHKLHYKSKKGITKPEVIICETAHSAFYKAADFFNVKLVIVPVTKNY